ncbi:MAG TPA: glycosyltransferase [Myxococcota bacterium]|nr:glycosyltransferase [Myxococcota bacterium]HQK50233.1 glycosyltransferase [Myxococcota bacterium]
MWSRFRGLVPWLVAALALLWVAFHLPVGDGRLSLVGQEWFGRWVVRPAVAMGLVVAVSTVWRIVLWALYRPGDPVDPEALPPVTVAVPAYQEGPRAGECLRSILASHYPRDRLRVVAVDDGSRDDTRQHLEAVAREDDRVEVVGCSENRGKRAALLEAFERVRSPIVVTVDSDTIVEPEAIRRLVGPLVRDARVGAVAGRIEAWNRRQNALTRMLGVRYRYGFDFIRAYQSMIGGVLVCPGALSAWRMEAIGPGLGAWRHQRFLGRECRNGDDHAQTNAVLSRGYRTVYQGDAVALTHVPATYGGLSRMYLRWARSNLRESLRYLAFAPRLARDPRRLASVIDAVTLFVQIPLRLYLLPLSWAVTLTHPAVLVPAVLSAMVASLLPALVSFRSERGLEGAWAVLYGVFSLLTLQWIYPAAAVTVRSNRWLTR